MILHGRGVEDPEHASVVPQVRPTGLVSAAAASGPPKPHQDAKQAAGVQPSRAELWRSEPRLPLARTSLVGRPPAANQSWVAPLSRWLYPVCQFQSRDSRVVFLVIRDQDCSHGQRVACNKGIKLPDRSSNGRKGCGNLAERRGCVSIESKHLYSRQKCVDRLMDLARLAIVSSETKLSD